MAGTLRRKKKHIETEENGVDQEIHLDEPKDTLSIVRRWCAEAKKKNISPLYLASEAGSTNGVHALLLCTLDLVENESEDVKQYIAIDVKTRLNKVEDQNVRTFEYILISQTAIDRILQL